MSKAYFWSLVITSHITSVCLWSRDGESTSVEILGPEIAWENEEDLIKAVDTSLTEVSSQMPEDAGEPTKTVFGVMGSWVSDGHIKKEHLSRIREVCEKLSLNPVGFVVIPEALSHEVKQNEGGPLSAVLIGVTKEFLEVTLFRLGNMSGNIEVGRSLSLSEDVIEALSRLSTHEPLPSRFMVFGPAHEELEDISHLLTSVKWKDVSDKLNFLHEPKIESVSADKLLSSISLAGSSEMGPVRSFTTPKPATTPTTEDDLNVVSTGVSLDELGFAMNADIAKISPLANDESDILEEAVEDTSEDPQLMHTVKASPLSRIKATLLSHLKPLTKRFFKNHNSTLPIETVHERTIHRPVVRKRMTVGQFVGIVCVVLSVLFLGIGTAWYYFPRAEITIFISPRTLTSRETFTLSDSATAVDLSSKLLPATVSKKTVSLDATAQASGTKTIGDKAKGTITVRNGTSNGVNLPSGALIVGPNDLQFTIDQSASVSAATSPTTPGQVTVPATAMAIGADSNLPSGQQLKVGKFLQSEIDAVVADAFTGGSSKQITAVSKADLDALEKDTLQKLTAQASQEISGEIPDDHQFIADSVKTATKSKTFDHKVGDEASTINLSMEVEATAYSIPKDAISKASQELLSNQVPSGYSFRPEQVETSFDVQAGSSVLTASVGFTAHLLPDVNPDDVARAIAGKRFGVANNYLGTIPGFVRAAITSHPALPDPIRFVPFVKSHIVVSIQAEQ